MTDDARRSLFTAARRLPGDGLAALELRLAPGHDQVDLSYRVHRRSSARRLAGTLAAPRAARLLHRWGHQDENLAVVRSIWLEIDLDREPTEGTEPITCVELEDGTAAEPLIARIGPALTNRPLLPQQERLLIRCLDALQAPAAPLYLFDLHARRARNWRLELHRLHPSEMADYLERLDQGRAAEQVTAATPLIEGCDRFHLSMDIGTTISPRIGVEASFRRLPHQEPGWQRLFERLVRAGLCPAEKRDAVLAWPGWNSLRTSADRWPSAARRPGMFCARCLSHIKLVFQPDRSIEAKVYLLFAPVDKSPVPRGDTAS